MDNFLRHINNAAGSLVVLHGHRCAESESEWYIYGALGKVEYTSRMSKLDSMVLPFADEEQV